MGALDARGFLIYMPIKRTAERRKYALRISNLKRIGIEIY